MRYLLFALLFLSAPAFAQTALPLKGANEITMLVPDSADHVYARLARSLAGAGYQLSRADKELLIVSTFPHPAPTLNMLCAYSATVHPTRGGALVKMRGTVTLPGLSSGAQNIVEYRGMEGSPAAIAWQEMEVRLRAAFPGLQASYAKQP